MEIGERPVSRLFQFCSFHWAVGLGAAITLSRTRALSISANASVIFAVLKDMLTVMASVAASIGGVLSVSAILEGWCHASLSY
jgi:hypothetical protein